VCRLHAGSRSWRDTPIHRERSAMGSIRRVVKQSARRLGLDGASRLLARALVGLALFVCLSIVIDRLFYIGLSLPAYLLVVGVLAAAVVVVLSVRRWPTPLGAAIELDDRLHLCERLSSALAVEESDEAMAQAVVDDARAYTSGLPVAETFPFRFHREYLGALCTALLALGLFAWMPQFDLWGRQAEQKKLQEEQQAVKRQASRMRRELKKLQRYVDLSGPKEAQAHLERMEEVIRRMEKGTMKRAEAMAELRKMAEVLRDARQGLAKKQIVPKGMLKKRDFDLTRSLAKALQQKDFQSAAQELRRLAQDAAQKQQLSEEQLEQLRQKLEELIKRLKEENLDELAEKLKALAEKTAKQQLSPQELEELQKQLAELAKELQKRGMPALSQELKKLCEQAAACQQARAGLAQLQRELAQLSQSLSESPGLCDSLSGMAAMLSQGNMQGLAEAMQGALLEFDDLAQLDAELAVLAACQGLCEGGQRGLAKRLLATWDGAGLYSPGDTRGMGPGMRGPGIGIGGIAPVEPGDVAFDPTKIKGQARPGRVVGSYFMDGTHVKGEARVEYQETVTAAAREAADAIDKEEIPRAYKDYVRDYFEEMRKE